MTNCKYKNNNIIDNNNNSNEIIWLDSSSALIDNASIDDVARKIIVIKQFDNSYLIWY